ncbi:MAG: hypothetical protein ACI8WB_003201, partial [Phenylobacterium sp.]
MITLANTTGEQNDSAVATLRNGYQIAVWDDEHTGLLKGKLYQPNGRVVKANIALMNDAGGPRHEVNVIALADGGFMVGGLAGSNIVTQRFTHDGEALGSPAIVNTVDTDLVTLYGENKQVTLTEMYDGRYLVGWTSTAAQDGDGM